MVDMAEIQRDMPDIQVVVGQKHPHIRISGQKNPYIGGLGGPLGMCRRGRVATALGAGAKKFYSTAGSNPHRFKSSSDACSIQAAPIRYIQYCTTLQYMVDPQNIL